MIRQPKNNLFLRSRIPLFFILLLICSVSFAISSTQKEGYLEVFGNIRQDSLNLEGAEVKVMKDNVAFQTLYTTANGKFEFKLPFNAEYIVSVGKPGLLTKSISISTIVPDEVKDIIFVYKLNIDLRPAEGDSVRTAVIKPIARIAYDTTYQDFDLKLLK